MSVHLFCGPSLPCEIARELYPDAVIHGPAVCGDVYLACSAKPDAIGIIDGYFDHSLSVWHKEVLWAISLGIPVYGAASMGALRAAELAAFGMRGVGRIYERYLDRTLEDDDEVAVLHESRERGFCARTHALVNIRATLRAAVFDHVVGPQEEEAVVLAAKRLFYADRTFRAAVDATPELDAGTKAALTRWVTNHGVVDQKRADALELIATMQRDLKIGHATTVPIFHFEQTNFWRVFRAKLDSAVETPKPPSVSELATAPPNVHRRDPEDGQDALGRRLLDALHSQNPELCAQVLTRARERALALMIGNLRSPSTSATDVQDESERFRKAHRLLTPETTARWLAANDIGLEGFSSLARDELIVRQFIEETRRLVLEQVPNVLRTIGVFQSLRASDAWKPAD